MALHHPIIRVSDIEKTEEKCISVVIDSRLDLPAEMAQLKNRLQGEVTFELKQNFLICSGDFQALVELTCDRCLGPYIHPIDLAIYELLDVVKKRREETESELTLDELREQVTRHEPIDVLDLIRQHLILSLPAKKLCSENCYNKELSQFNKDSDGKNIDPRWEDLKKITESWNTN